ncbi:unnamed protein product [Linum tenue]|uniref:Uncharacterized protein n=1 Tax=Linum tenue TaxID=586396 RepID=A0AAV0GYB4_9ROSI|nr:unnamed protein product [Linum tenue]
MAQVSFSKAAALSVFLLVASLATIVSAQEMAPAPSPLLLVASLATIVSAQEMAPAPSPSQVTGAGFSVPASGAFVAVSVVVSLMGLLKM